MINLKFLIILFFAKKLSETAEDQMVDFLKATLYTFSICFFMLSVINVKPSYRILDIFINAFKYILLRKVCNLFFLEWRIFDLKSKINTVSMILNFFKISKCKIEGVEFISHITTSILLLNIIYGILNNDFNW